MSFFENLRRLKATKMMAVMRVGAYFAVVTAVLGAYATHEAKAAITEEGFILGRDLAKVADLLDHTYEIRINGQTAYMASVDSSLPMKEILDRYQAMCTDNAGLVAQAWKDIPEPQREIKGTGNFAGLVANMGVVRKESSHEGMVACIANGPNQAASPMEGFQKFVKTGEVSYVGKLRYVYITGPSSSGRWTVTTIWTENNFNINQIMMPEGTDDAPGTDSPTCGRPPSAQRVFSASITGAPYGIRTYISTATPENVYAKFDAVMTSDGWMLFTTEGAPHTYVKDGILTMVSAGLDNGKTVVMINELGGNQLRTPEAP
jgi:hypothetical protein